MAIYDGGWIRSAILVTPNPFKATFSSENCGRITTPSLNHTQLDTNFLMVLGKILWWLLEHTSAAQDQIPSEAHGEPVTDMYSHAIISTVEYVCIWVFEKIDKLVTWSYSLEARVFETNRITHFPQFQHQARIFDVIICDLHTDCMFYIVFNLSVVSFLIFRLFILITGESIVLGSILMSWNYILWSLGTRWTLFGGSVLIILVRTIQSPSCLHWDGWIPSRKPFLKELDAEVGRKDGAHEKCIKFESFVKVSLGLD